MRLLVRCAECRRQYDATGKEPGRQFRCRCGEVVTVEQPAGHDAAVVRCSGCGAPRNEGAQTCGFCTADFTLHERDLHTVCPKCMARVSDRARFCHHCGTGLVPESVAGDETPLPCPACGESHRLTSRAIGEVAVMECGRCAGLWIGNRTFEQLTERAAEAGRNGDARCKTPRPSPPSETKSPGKWQYRHCVVCGKIMHRHHYGIRSGVIIDLCKAHGVWLDADELPRILAYLRDGKEAAAKKLSEGGPCRSGMATGSGLVGCGVDDGPHGSFVDLLGELVHWVFKS